MAEKRDTSEIALCNRALSLIKHTDITSFEQPNSLAARQCKLHYAATRDALIRTYRWNCAQTRDEIGVATGNDVPLFGFTYAYKLPLDCLRVIELPDAVDQEENWSLEENRRILTDLPPLLKIIYNRVVLSPAEFDPLLAKLFEHTLALEIAPVLSTDESTIKRVEKTAGGLRAQAQPIDAREGRRKRRTKKSNWLDAREGYL